MAPGGARADGDADLIHVCVHPGSGLIRVVGAPDACRPPEMPLTWNVGSHSGAGISGYETVAHQEWLAAGAVANVHVECPPGKKVLGGGFDVEFPEDVKVYSSEPTDGLGNAIDHGWNVMVLNAGTVTRQATAMAICAVVP
jgi:hypothetical protein